MPESTEILFWFGARTLPNRSPYVTPGPIIPPRICITRPTCRRHPSAPTIGRASPLIASEYEAKMTSRRDVLKGISLSLLGGLHLDGLNFSLQRNAMSSKEIKIFDP